MGENSAIEWTDHTFNPWWGCVKVSEGCKNCYAETFANRFGDWFGLNTERRMFGDKHWNQPLKWNRKAQKEGKRFKVFCGSMCDFAEQNKALPGLRNRLGELIKSTPYLDWLLLTKRSFNMNYAFSQMGFLKDKPKSNNDLLIPDNVWVGVTVENSDNYYRINDLIKVPAKVKFLSCEPLLGELDLGLRNWIEELDEGVQWWVIAGGESGNNARPMNPEWVRLLQEDCKIANVPFFFKQWGEWGPTHELKCNDPGIKGKEWFNFDPDNSVCKIGKKNAGSTLDGNQYKEFPS